MPKFTVTTPIFYANGVPHIGHAYNIVAADILARLYKLLGNEVFFLTGTDEHGAKVAEAAQKNNKTPQEFVDEISNTFKSAWKNLDIEYSDFIRTTESRHEKGVIFALNKLKEEGVLYEKKYEGLYCIGCEAFVTEKDLDAQGLEPLHKTKPILIEEKNWFFKLSEFLPQIKEAIETGRLKIEPQERKNEVLGLLEQGLADFSISRSKERLKWGITLPFYESQVAYVWVDALLNYITALGYGSEDQSKFEKFWPADVQLIGQDILKFHAIYWPAILLALGLELPKSLVVHGYFTVNGQKMSKTIGNVIDPNNLVEEFGSDAARYLLLTQFPFGSSGDIDVKNFQEKYNDLANTFGNLVRRVFNLAEKYELKDISIDKFDESEFVGKTALGNIQLIQNIVDESRQINAELDKSAPWKEENPENRNEIIKNTIKNIFKLAFLMQTIMPKTSKIIFDSVQNGRIVNPPILFPKNEK